MTVLLPKFLNVTSGSKLAMQIIPSGVIIPFIPISSAAVGALGSQPSLVVDVFAGSNQSLTRVAGVPPPFHAIPKRP